MHYIQVIELEYIQAVSCKVKGLPLTDLIGLERDLTDLRIIYTKQEHFFEVDAQGVQILNMLCNDAYKYKVCGQAMTIEKSNIGGRTDQIQITAWTLEKE